MLKVTTNIKTVEKRAKKRLEMTKAEVTTIIKKVSEIGYVNLINYSPVDTGKMKASIKLEVQAYSSILSVNTDYAEFVERGGGQPRTVGIIPFFSVAIEDIRNALKMELMNR